MMLQNTKTDIGSIHVHKKVLADIIRSSLREIEGASLVSAKMMERVGGLLGRETFPGIQITVDKANHVTLAISVFVKYGVHIPDIAKQIQEIVRTSIERTIDIQLKDIHINIQGLERGRS